MEISIYVYGDCDMGRATLFYDKSQSHLNIILYLTYLGLIFTSRYIITDMHIYDIATAL